MNLRFEALGALGTLAMLVGACSSDASRSPACGLSFIASPTLIREQLRNPRAIITDAPRGLPDSLPAMVIRQKQGAVRVTYDPLGKSLVMEYSGDSFPTRGGYGLLVVDDTSHRAVGVLFYESEEPKDHPNLGTVTGGTATVLLYGVKVDWASVSNPKCPILGAPAPKPANS